MTKETRGGAKHKKKGHGVAILVVALVIVSIAIVASGAVLLVHHQPQTAAAVAQPKVLPLNVVTTNPANGAQDIASSTTLTVDLSTALDSTSPMPMLTPAVAGSWSLLSPSELQFVGDGPLVPGSTETLTIPGGPIGLLGAQGQRMAASVTVTFNVAQGSTLRLQQLLAQLGYLPLSFSPATQPTSPQQEADAQQGTFNWRWANQPTALMSLWTPGTYNVVTKGAVMVFESQHGQKTDGLAGPDVWTDLLLAAAAGTTDPQPYAYVYVSKGHPESAAIYQNGSEVYSTLANTGVAAAATPDGTWPVYERFKSTTMTGTNPDGTKYSDPNIPWVSYFTGGDAVHGFVRGSYGYPQSDGCVELPPANAAVVWPLTPIGTLVTVQ